MVSKKNLCLFILVLNATFCLLKPDLVLAQVVINEVMPASTTGNDWVELFNQGDQSANLASWTVEDSTSAMTTNPAISSQIVPSKGFLVVEVGNRLNNTGDAVKLKNQLGQIVDSFSYTQASLDLSWARIPDGTGAFQLSQASRGNANQIATDSALPTPNADPSPNPSPIPTSISSPVPTPPTELPSHIAISEIMACPNTDEPEWVELQNLDNQDVSLTHWEIKDAQNNARYFTATLSPQGMAVIQIKPPMLNNDGDQLSVIRPDGVTTSWASYTTCVKGKSLIYDGQVWIPTDPTPGAENPDLESTATPAPTPSPTPLVPPVATPAARLRLLDPTPTATPKLVEVSDSVHSATPVAYFSATKDPLTTLPTSQIPAKSTSLSRWILFGSGGWCVLVAGWMFWEIWLAQQTHRQNRNSTLGSFLQL